ncbi:hypothetical protein ACH47Z_38900 [Streptomyces sp. NPDC020192]|uniref:hypothetical protein n=1 Tax=Streptomyces sp. NPDC020192 TaxID=3365066 RepID=UPI00378754AD
MTESVYHPATPEIGPRRAQLAPAVNEAFDNFSRAVFAEGALPEPGYAHSTLALHAMGETAPR